jgi:GTP-binding protein
VVADVPGLVEGAHEGKGLGIRFLKHVQRTTVLLHVLDATHEDPMADYEIIRRELEAFDPELAKRREIVAINKVDTLAADQRDGLASITEELSRRKVPCLTISAATGEGTDRLLNGLTRSLRRLGGSQDGTSEDHE